MSHKYVWMANLLKEQIFMHAKNDPYKLPTERELCEKYDVSRQTVRRALSILLQENLIEKRQGSGSYTTGLRMESSNNTVVILISCDNEYIYPSLLFDMQSVLRKEGYPVSVYTTKDQIAAERAILEQLVSNPPRGLIVEGIKTALPNPNQDLYERLGAIGVSVLFLNGSYSNLPDPACIRSDNIHGGYLLGKHLVKQGHVKIAGIFKSDDIQGVERYYGWMNALRDSLIQNPDTHIAWFSSTELTTLRKNNDTGFLTAFIRRQLKPCTAVICHNDEIAYWLIKELSHADYRVPENISIVSFDNSYLSTLSSVPITSLSLKPHEMGYSASMQLIKMMQGNTVSSKVLPWHLVSRRSVACCTMHS